MNVAIQPRKSLRFRGRSFMALVFAPEPPLADWFSELDEWCGRSPGYFVGRPILLDVSALPLDKEGLAALVADLHARDIRIMGVEGTKPSLLGLGMPPLVSGGKQAGAGEFQDLASLVQPKEAGPREAGKASAPVTAPPRPQPEAPSLMHDSPVRSGQSVIFPPGDVTVLGSVASGAEVVAGGSIHVYGTLRGRAIAGSTGNARARIFCNRLEAELVAIDGLYRTADEMEQVFRGRPVQAWLQDDAMMMAALT